jgi:tripartite ATP-independent transporter DctP family solute receptor
MHTSLISRRLFSLGLAAAGASALLDGRSRGAAVEMRQFHNQPAESPLHKSLVAMWAAVEKKSAGRVRVQTFAENDHLPGGDPAALSMIIDGSLDFFAVNGGLIGAVAPAVNIQGMPFAFRDLSQVFTALDGDLGAYLGDEMRAKGIYALPRGCFDNGFQQLSSSTHPIRTVADLEGVKVRTPNTPIYIELFEALGAKPVPVNIDKLYETLKAKVVDVQTDPLTIIELFKLYEVQKYVSITNHIWGGFNLITNWEKWQNLPAEDRGVIERNVAKFVKLQRSENAALNGKLRATLTQQGMSFNEAETGSFRAKLGPFYASWKQKVGQRAWSLLESHIGPLG